MLLSLAAFALCSLALFLFKVDWEKAAMAAVAVVLLFWPLAAERVLRARFSPGLVAALAAFALGPMLGQAYQLYYRLPVWDSILHAASGVLFALIGFYTPVLATRGQAAPSKPFRYAAATGAALATAVLWEFFEFGSDRLFGTDMQNDAIVYEITSYLLGPGMGEVGTLRNIGSVAVNGRELGLGGYLDIGLIDTMTDMLACAGGAVLFCLGETVNKGRRKAITPANPPK